MGTRSLTHIKDEQGNTLVTIYRQYDGYPSGLGADIKETMGDAKIINGISGQQAPEAFNGMGCMAAWLIGQLKAGKIGNVYIYPPNSKNCGEEFVYTLYVKNKELHINVQDTYDDGHLLFDGCLADFNPKEAEAVKP